MPRREKPKPKIDFEDDDDDDINLHHHHLHKSFSDSDDEAANEDLTLKIIQKAMSRDTHSAASDAAADGDGDGDGGVVVTGGEISGANGAVEKKKKRKKKKLKKGKKVDADIISSVTTTVEIEDAIKDAEVVNVSTPDAVEQPKTDNVILRRLLRGPRYFDPPDKSWGACFNCGEEGHSAINCTSARRKRPCFVCGSLEHEVKQCQKGQDCFVCKEQGHRAKDCPNKMKRSSVVSELCLKCGASSHAMFSCSNDYSPDDLKDIQCYVCKRFGHLCCASYFGALATEASCYKCGQAGHNGQDCKGSRGETSAGVVPSLCFKCGEDGHFARECRSSAKDGRGFKGDMSAGGTPGSCFKCGEEGHFARECRTSGKTKKRSRDPLTPASKKYPKDSKGNKGHRSAPLDNGKSRKKKAQVDDGSPKWAGKSKRRGGWIPDEQDDLSHKNGWRSPATPNKKHKIFSLTAGDQGHNRQFYDRRSNISPGTSSSHRYGNAYHHTSGTSRSPAYGRAYDHTPGTSSSPGYGKAYHLTPASLSSPGYDKAFHHTPLSSNSPGYGKAYQHRYTASRFGNASSNGMRRDYDWW